ncbi:ATP-binding cassette domain-containing protein [Epidermidibacterium keratini]|uniref:ATP-binding cassette domain-containing protein n=1 Tax=Epidermidibacterium keratini TaxID=1891644 RepID=A0A7L4YQL5_9ACTN|nr:ATP-binding cassette domain-containing protein [Epidermidibacterium keratini]QHC01079.1 ATP-binding cassette domain-containing protein [Epidermidibacterium keratini]
MAYADAIVECIDLAARFGPEPVFTGLTLVAQPGIVALLGPNGAGKTTLLRILTTLRRPDAGAARVLGFDVVRQQREVRRNIAVVGQFPAVDNVLTGRENLVMTARLAGLGRRSRGRADALLDQFGLTDAAGRAVNGWSGGMRRRLDIAAALVRLVPLLFLDEPTTGMDPESRRRLWDDLRGLAGDDVSVVLTTQYLYEAERLADRVLLLFDGGIAADGSPDQLRRAVGDARVEARDSSGAVIAEIPTDGSASDVRRITDQLGAGVTIDIRRPTLDDAYLSLTATRRGERPGERAQA